MSAIQVGTVEVLRDRVYQVDPLSTAPDTPTAYVRPGVYLLFRDEAGAHFWTMTGRLNERHVDFQRLGKGMFGVKTWDEPHGNNIEFQSNRFAPDEWTELLAHEQATEGDPEQRIRITITDGGDRS